MGDIAPWLLRQVRPAATRDSAGRREIINRGYKQPFTLSGARSSSSPPLRAPRRCGRLIGTRGT
jgi:hypothetical protein